MLTKAAIRATALESVATAAGRMLSEPPPVEMDTADIAQYRIELVRIADSMRAQALRLVAKTSEAVEMIRSYYTMRRQKFDGVLRMINSHRIHPLSVDDLSMVLLETPSRDDKAHQDWLNLASFDEIVAYVESVL